MSARERVNKAFDVYTLCPNRDNNDAIQKEKEALIDEYATAEDEELTRQIRCFETANSQSQHSLSWKIINEITGRKSAKQGMIKGSSREERIKKWYDHFQKLLGKEPVISNSGNEEITTIFNDLSISVEPFNSEEYNAVKRKLVDNKAAGPDGIPPKYSNTAT